MKLNKYSDPKDNATVIGSFADRKTSSSSSPSSSSPSVRNDRDIWGQPDTGDDIDGDMLVNGNVFIGDVDYDDEDRPVPPDHEFPSDNGNLYAALSLGALQVYGKDLFLDVNGTKTNLLDILMPVGSIIMFNGQSAVPANWAICDGSKGTPNLKDRFIKGVVTKEDANKTGGRSTVDMGNLIPVHTHTFYNYLTQVHGNAEVNYGPINIDGRPTLTVGASHSDVAPTHRAQTEDSGWSDLPYIINETDPAGTDSPEGSSVNIEPPFYTLIFIMRIK